MNRLGRRLRYGFMTVIIIAAATISLILVNVVAARWSIQFDATTTRSHELAPRTKALLERITGSYEIVLAADSRQINRRALDRVGDVLHQIARTCDNVRITRIDTGSASGIVQYDTLLDRLTQRDAEQINHQTTTISQAADGLDQIAAFLDQTSTRLESVRDAIPDDTPNAATNKAYFQQRAALSRIRAREIREATQAARQAINDSVRIPDTDHARAKLLEPASLLTRELRALAENLDTFSEAQMMPEQARQLAGALIPAVLKHRDTAAMLADAVDRLKRLDLLRVAQALENNAAVLVIGPPEVGITAIDVRALFASADVAVAVSGSTADVRRNSEELLATALASLANPIKPVVVLMHGGGEGELTSQRVFSTISARLDLRGIDLVEWAAVADSQAPSLRNVDPSGERPVVYIILSPQSWATQSSLGLNGIEIAQRLGERLLQLIESGENVLVSLNPSTLPAFGATDAISAALAPFGIEADSGRPILQEQFTSFGRVVRTDQRVVTANDDHILPQAITGLPTMLTWPISIHQIDTPDELQVQFIPLLSIEPGERWAESQWLGYRQIPRDQRHLVPNPPQNDSTRDDAAGPWVVAAAVQRKVPGLDHAHRLIVIGSNDWFVDQVIQEASVIDGRIVSKNPGHIELFEAAFYWLAGQDELIAQSATARAIAMVQPIEPTQLTLIRWIVIAALPALVLLIGVFWRIVRG